MFTEIDLVICVNYVIYGNSEILKCGCFICRNSLFGPSPATLITVRRFWRLYRNIAPVYTAEMDVDGDVDSQLLQQFSSMATTDREVLIAEFQRLLGNQLSDAGCAFFLDMNNWQVIVERVTSELVTR